MASSSDTRTRGFVPPQNEDERFLMRRVEELCRTAMQRGIPRATGFLSDREQALAQAALNREGCDFARFQGGWPDAERKVLCIEPPDSWPEEPVAVLHFTAPQQGGSAVPGHRDYLGAILGLGLDRACLGDILPDPADARSVYAFVLEDKADFIASNLTEAGRSPVHVERCRAGRSPARAGTPDAGCNGAIFAGRYRIGSHDAHLPLHCGAGNPKRQGGSEPRSAAHRP